MTDLTLEELAELGAFLAAADGDHVATLILQERLLDAAPALLAMARELVRLKSALDFFDGQERFIDPASFIDDAIASGWEDPFPPPPAMEKP